MNRFSHAVMLVSLGVVLCGLGTAGHAAAPEQELPRLTVRGEAILYVPADQLNLRIGVVTAAETAEAGLGENTEKMDRVVKALQQVGLTQGEYETSQFQIQPRWSPRPRQAPAEWRPEIVGYSVTNSLNIRTRKLELAGKLIGAAAKAGANEIGAILFDLADPRQYRDDAIEAATANAIADARSLAGAASVRLLRVLSLTLDQAVATPVKVQAGAYAERAALAMDAPAPHMTSGDVTVRAHVLLVYQIDGLIEP
jgi:uncharacterized protein YggE